MRLHQQVGLRFPPLVLDDVQFSGYAVGGTGRAGQHPVGLDQVLDRVRDADLAFGQQDQEVGDPLELGQDVGRHQHGHAVLAYRREHRAHEVVPGKGVKRGEGLVEDKQPRPPGQRQGQRELCPLPAGQLRGFAVQRDVKLAQPGAGVGRVEAAVQVPGEPDHVRGGQVRVHRRVLRDERDAVQRGARAGGQPPENGRGARGRGRQAYQQVQQRGLARAVGPDQRGQVPPGQRERAVPQRPGPAVVLAQANGLDDVHATPSSPAFSCPGGAARPP